MTSGASVASSTRVSARIVHIAPRPAIVELDVLPGSSSQLLQSLQESRIADLRLRIVRDVEHEETDAAHALGLLRPRRQRPSGRRAAEKGDELAASHCPMPPVLPTERIAPLGTADC